jgi:hypothetical protein
MGEPFSKLLKPLAPVASGLYSPTGWLRIAISASFLIAGLGYFGACWWFQSGIGRLPFGYTYNPKGAVIRNRQGRSICTQCFYGKKEERLLKENSDGTLECPLTECAKKYQEWA